MKRRKAIVVVSEDSTKRVERQRTLFTMMPDTRARERFLEAMVGRVRLLLKLGDTVRAETLMEFIPSREVELLMRELEAPPEPASDSDLTLVVNAGAPTVRGL